MICGIIAIGQPLETAAFAAALGITGQWPPYWRWWSGGWYPDREWDVASLDALAGTPDWMIPPGPWGHESILLALAGVYWICWIARRKLGRPADGVIPVIGLAALALSLYGRQLWFFAAARSPWTVLGEPSVTQVASAEIRRGCVAVVALWLTARIHGRDQRGVLWRGVLAVGAIRALDLGSELLWTSAPNSDSQIAELGWEIGWLLNRAVIAAFTLGAVAWALAPTTPRGWLRRPGAPLALWAGAIIFHASIDLVRLFVPPGLGVPIDVHGAWVVAPVPWLIDAFIVSLHGVVTLWTILAVSSAGEPELRCPRPS